MVLNQDILNTCKSLKIKPSIIECVGLHTEIDTIPRFTFRWGTVTKDIITKHIGRSVRSTIGEKRNNRGF